jgi:hypothetical protein
MSLDLKPLLLSGKVERKDEYYERDNNYYQTRKAGRD